HLAQALDAVRDHARVQLRVSPGAEDDLPDRPIVRRPIELPEVADQCLDVEAAIGGETRLSFEALGNAPVDLVEDREDQLVLGREMVVQGTRREAGALGDQRRGRARIADAPQELGRRFDEQRAGLGAAILLAAPQPRASVHRYTSYILSHM